MGEYIKHNGRDVKIGTCESLYYATFNHLNNHEHGKAYAAKNAGFLFRFPFPDENFDLGDNIDDYDRGELLAIPAGIGVEICHGKRLLYIEGANKSLVPHAGIYAECPQSESFGGMRWHGSDTLYLEVVQQKYTDDGLTTICRCPYCGARSQMLREEMQVISEHYATRDNSEFERSIIDISLSGYDI